jgi:hypothetical protein
VDGFVVIAIIIITVPANIATNVMHLITIKNINKCECIIKRMFIIKVITTQ